MFGNSVLQGQTPPRFCLLEQLLQLDVSVLGLPSPLLWCRLSVLRCLDVVPLGLLRMRQQQLLGQALKERKFVNLVQFGNQNKFRVKINGRLVKGTNRAVIESKELGFGAISGEFLRRGGEFEDFWTTWLNVAPGFVSSLVFTSASAFLRVLLCAASVRIRGGSLGV